MKEFWQVFRLKNKHILSIYIALFAYLLFNLLSRNFGLNYNYSLMVESFAILFIFFLPFKFINSRVQLLFLVFLSLIFTSILGALLNEVPVLNYLFGFRGQYLAMIIFFATVQFFSVNNFHRIFYIFYKFQYLNIILTIIQFVILSQTGDNNNGAFVSGAGQDIFCGALVAYYTHLYANKQTKLVKLVFVISSSIFIAILQNLTGFWLC